MFRHSYMSPIFHMKEGVEHTPQVFVSCFDFGNLATRSHLYDVSHNVHRRNMYIFKVKLKCVFKCLNLNNFSKLFLFINSKIVKLCIYVLHCAFDQDVAKMKWFSFHKPKQRLIIFIVYFYWPNEFSMLSSIKPCQVEFKNQIFQQLNQLQIKVFSKFDPTLL